MENTDVEMECMKWIKMALDPNHWRPFDCTDDKLFRF
jgi:hypothetical protein